MSLKATDGVPKDLGRNKWIRTDPAFSFRTGDPERDFKLFAMARLVQSQKVQQRYLLSFIGLGVMSMRLGSDWPTILAVFAPLACLVFSVIKRGNATIDRLLLPTQEAIAALPSSSVAASSKTSESIEERQLIFIEFIDETGQPSTMQRTFNKDSTFSELLSDVADYQDGRIRKSDYGDTWWLKSKRRRQAIEWPKPALTTMTLLQAGIESRDHLITVLRQPAATKNP